MTDNPDKSDGVPDSSSAAERAHLAGELDSLPPTWCFNCKAEVKPKGKGNCPRCGRVLKGAFLARKHPVNILRRQQLLDRLLADYNPSTTVLRAKCEHLAGVLEQLEVLKAGSQEHKRLVELSEQLGASLEESRPRELDDAREQLVIRRVIVSPDGTNYDS